MVFGSCECRESGFDHDLVTLIGALIDLRPETIQCLFSAGLNRMILGGSLRVMDDGEVRGAKTNQMIDAMGSGK